ncbi:MAG: DNA primase [Terriglobales bacterium]
MSAFSDELKARADLGQLIGEVVALKPSANGFIGLCPFHGERTPSFHVHTGKRFYYCFGCHAHGDIFSFFMQLRQQTFPEAVEYVAERLGIAPPRDADREIDPERQSLYELHAAAAAFYARCLREPAAAAARAHLAARELNAQDLDGFDLGFASESGRELTRWLESQGCTPALALRAGLCQLRREHGADAAPSGATGWADLYDRFRQRLMFPIRDERGRVIALAGRALGESDDRRVPKYLNSPEHPLYTKGRVLYNLDRARRAIRELGYVILVEGYFDCIRVFAAGFNNVVASCGTALTAAQIGALSRLTHKAAINFDPDAAGAAAAERSIGLLLEENFQMRVVVLESGLDPDAFVRQRGREAYGETLKSSRSFFDYLAERAGRQFDLRTAAGKLGAVNHLLPYLSHVHEPILRQNLAENLAAQLGLEQGLISRQLVEASRQRRISLPEALMPTMLPAERVVLRAWLGWEQERERLTRLLQEEKLVEGLASERLLGELGDRQASAADWQQLSAGLAEADRRWIAQLLLSDADEESLSATLLESALDSLRQRCQQRHRRQLKEDIAAAAAAGDKQRLEVLLREKAAADVLHHN